MAGSRLAKKLVSPKKLETPDTANVPEAVVFPDTCRSVIFAWVL